MIPSPRPWYREPYVWLLISFPLLAVLGSLLTITLAIESDDGLVSDDYYREGLAINEVLDRDLAARRLGLHAALEVNPAAGRAAVLLEADSGFVLPPTVQATFMSATRAGLDQQVTLVRDGAGVYRGELAPLARGRWHVQLAAGDWRLLLHTTVD
ncbi:MAG: FixH family protein [Gammaproteobacteria bacterium]|nr:FixH family protein [Gammaproteobacteria bacterium]